MLKLIDRVNNTSAYRQIVDSTRSNKRTAAFGAQKNEKAIIAHNLCVPFVYVTSDYVEAQQTTRTLTALGGNYKYLPYSEDVLMFKNAQHAEQRNWILYQLATNQLDGVVVCTESLMQYLPPSNWLVNSSVVINKGQELPQTELLRRLIAIGYRRVDALECSGQVVVRGDIVELMCLDIRYRIDYWADTIDNIVAIEEDRTSSHSVDNVIMVPTTSTMTANNDIVQRILSNNKHKISADAHARLSTIIDKIVMQLDSSSYGNNWLVPFVDNSVLSHYLTPDTIIVWDEPKLIASKSNFLYNEQDARVANLIEAGEILPIHTNTLVDRFKLYATYQDQVQLCLQTLPYGGTFYQPDNIVKLSTSAVSHYGGAIDKLKQDISHWLQFGYEVVLCAGDLDTAKSIYSQLAGVGTYLAVGDTFAAGSADGLIVPLTIESGFVSHSNKLTVIGTRELGRSSNKKLSVSNKKSAFLTAVKGEYVVHEHHGIGLFEGVQRLENGSDYKDYFVVLYKLGDRLYVPAENSNSLTRYSGGDNPQLSKLGGAEFARLKSKVKASIKEMSINLVQLYASRNKRRGWVYNVDEYLARQFANGFAYQETDDQLKSIREIADDMSKDKIMDRLLVGDVGFGKTEVAMRAVFTAVSNGYQSAVLAPTTILAEQHFESFRERLAPFDIKVACLNRFRTAQQQKEIINAVKNGQIDVIIGTHRLLSADIKFDKLSLLVLDEEQRFGVEHKERIKSIKNNIDVLTLSATPIPRTLHMALSGIRDVSTITTPPPTKQAVDTYVVESNMTLMRDIVMRELGRGGQIFVVYNRVESIDRFAHSLADNVPEAKVIVAHGQMSERALEDAILNFSYGKSNVLVCSTIIENGINILNANSLIVCDADRLGLSQLYQLRGRVGRGDKLGYAYFMYSEDKVLSSDAYKRLASITQYSELGSGFKIAMQDLEIRGAGNILGREQHGHMIKVGYDMYAKLLAEAVGELQGNTKQHQTDCDLIIDIDAYAPDNYIASADERMQAYQQIASCSTIEELEKLSKQLAEVYGVMPTQMNNLITIARVKVLAGLGRVCRAIIKANKAVLYFAGKEDMFRDRVVDAVVSSNGQWTFATNEYCVTAVDTFFVVRERLIGRVIDFLTAISLS